MSLWIDLLAAIQFSTRFPVPAYRHEELTLARAAKFFPLVGLLIGAAGWGIYSLVARAANSQVRCLFVLCFFVLVTGALHEDGLADAADGFGGGWTRARILEIMRDSRIGSFGAVAIALSLLARFVLLSNLDPARFGAYVISAQVLCRCSTLPLGRVLPPARPAEGSGSRLARRISTASLLFGVLFSIATVLILLGRASWLPLLITVLITACTGVYYSRKIGGVTGDCFGATNQLTEIAIYLCGSL